MTRVHTQTLFLDSTQSSLPNDTPWQWSAVFEPGMVACGPGERLMLTLERFYTVADWDWIPPNTLFWVGDDSGAIPTQVLLPRGNPTLECIATTITNQVSYLECKYDVASNRFKFTSTKGFDITLTFPSPQVAAYLGFKETQVGPFLSATSVLTIRPLPIDAIKIEVLGVVASGMSHCGTNESLQLVRPCNALGIIPIDAVPFTQVDWSNSTGSFAMYLSDRSLSRLTFRLTDWHGNPLTQLSQHFLCLRVDTIRESNPTDAILTQVSQDLSAMRVMKIAKALS